MWYFTRVAPHEPCSFYFFFCFNLVIVSIDNINKIQPKTVQKSETFNCYLTRVTMDMYGWTDIPSAKNCYPLDYVRDGRTYTHPWLKSNANKSFASFSLRCREVGVITLLNLFNNASIWVLLWGGFMRGDSKKRRSKGLHNNISSGSCCCLSRGFGFGLT